MGAVILDADYCRRLLPPRDPDGHKGTFGTVLCVAGSLDYAGAGLLTSLSAARGGAGLVVLAVPQSLQPIVAGRVPEVVTLGLPRETPSAFELIKLANADALVVGPGLTEADEFTALVLSLISQDTPCVVDAGALNMLAKTDGWWERATADLVLTPHPGEFQRLTGSKPGSADDGRLASAQAAAQKFGQVMVLKGARTVIAAADGRAAVAPFATAALATAGSGDVLAGLVGALLAQGAEPFDAACLGVYLHGRAGERLSFRLGNAGVLASDIAHEIPATRHELDAHSA